MVAGATFQLISLDVSSLIASAGIDAFLPSWKLCQKGHASRLQAAEPRRESE